MADSDVLREGSRHTCPHCGRKVEVQEGTLKPIHNREAFDRATKKNAPQTGTGED